MKCKHIYTVAKKTHIRTIPNDSNSLAKCRDLLVWMVQYLFKIIYIKERREREWNRYIDAFYSIYYMWGHETTI